MTPRFLKDWQDLLLKPLIQLTVEENMTFEDVWNYQYGFSLIVIYLVFVTFHP